MKRLLVLLLTLSLMTGMIYAEEAETSHILVNVKVNDVLLGFDEQPVMIDGTTMIPIKTVMEVLGAQQLEWDGMSKQATVMHDTDTLVFGMDTKAYMHNGEIKEIATAPVMVNGTPMLPVRLIAETMACTVDWHGASRTVLITKEGIEVPEHHKATAEEMATVTEYYSEEELLWLSRIVNVEGLDIGFEAKLAIANVVLNRVKSDEYPDTVYNVIKDTNYAVQFPPAHKSGFDTLVPDEQSIEAAKAALSGHNNISDCLYFNNRPFRSKADDLYLIIEGEYFYH